MASPHYLVLVDSELDSDEGSDLYYLPQDHIILQPDVRVSEVQFSNMQILPCGQQKILSCLSITGYSPVAWLNDQFHFF